MMDAGTLLVEKKTGQLLQRDTKDAEIRSSISLRAGVSFFFSWIASISIGV